MIYRPIYEPAALDEYKEAVSWYAERSGITAAAFAEAVKERIKDICKTPQRYKNTYKYFRETSLKKYPYCVVYFLDDHAKLVIISSIYHHKRNPKKKYRK